MAQWDALVDGALASLAARRLLFNTRLIALAPPSAPSQTSFTGPGAWDRATVEIQVDRTSIQQWLAANGEVSSQEDNEVNRELILFSGNDYMCLSSHPAVREAAVKAAQEYGMGPRGSSLICGYTTYHKLVESQAKLQKKEDCLLCPTGFSANTALMTALGSIISLLAAGSKPAQGERIAIFSDALNHASTIDGIRLVERQHQAVAFVYKHCDMSHLDFLMSSCSMENKVVVTDSYNVRAVCSAWMGILLRYLNLYNYATNMDFCWSSMMHMERFFAARTVVAYLRCLDVKMTLT